MAKLRRHIARWTAVEAALTGVLIFLPVLVLVVILAQYSPAGQSNSDHNDVATAIYAALGIAYGVMLAQVVIATWGDYETVQDATFREAAALIDLSRLTEGLRGHYRNQIQEILLRYACIVETAEWRCMEMGEESCTSYHEGEMQLNALYTLYATAARDKETESAFLDAALSELDELGDARGTRLTAVRWTLHGLMWAAMVGGGMLIIAFVAVFEHGDFGAHLELAFFLLLAVAMFMALVFALDRPFNGPWGISRCEFERARRLIDPSAKQCM